MVTFTIIMFLFSVAGIVTLFAIKEWEEKNSRTLVPSFRQKLDVQALRLKELGAAAQKDLAKLPPEIVHLARVGIHIGALEAARFARFAEAQAHRLADLVSHKRRFVYRAPRSEFLKKVAEHKNGNGLDTTSSNGHNS